VNPETRRTLTDTYRRFDVWFSSAVATRLWGSMALWTMWSRYFLKRGSRLPRQDHHVSAEKQQIFIKSVAQVVWCSKAVVFATTSSWGRSGRQESKKVCFPTGTTHFAGVSDGPVFLPLHRLTTPPASPTLGIDANSAAEAPLG